MGTANSSVPVHDLSPGTTPTSQNWITAHARKSGLPLVEVQRLWDQFQQLGASRVTGRLNPAISPGSRLNYNSHLFINSLPKTGGNISFLNYCIACKGIEDFSEDEKLRAIFRLYNDGKEWDYSTLRKLVQSVYPRENDDVIKSTTDTLLSQFTYGSHDYVTEMDFMRFMQSFDDRNLLENCLAYKIVPQYLKNRPRDDHLSDYLPTTRSGDIRGPHGGGGLGVTDGGVGLPSDSQLKMVAQLMTEPRRDWRRLLNILGFTESEIVEAEEDSPNEPLETLQSLLRGWRDGGPGSTGELRQALTLSNNTDVANRL